MSKTTKNKSIGIPVYDVAKQKLVIPASNKEYIQIAAKMYEQTDIRRQKAPGDYKNEARIILAQNYKNRRNYYAARKLYNKLIKKGWLTEGYYGLATIAYEEGYYHETLLQLAKINTYTTDIYILQAKAYIALADLESALEPIQETYTRSPENADVLLLRATFYEHYYRTTLQDPHYLFHASNSYHQLFEKNIFQQYENQKRVLSDPCHLSYVNYITILLELGETTEAITQLERYFNVLPVNKYQDILFIPLPDHILKMLQDEETFGSYEHIQQTYGKQYAEKIKLTYKKQAATLLELLAYAYLLNNEIDMAKAKMEELLKFDASASTLIDLKKLISNTPQTVTFRVSLYLDRLQTIQQKFATTIEETFEPLYILQFKQTMRIAMHQIEVLEAEHDKDALQEAVRAFYDMKRHISNISLKSNMLAEHEVMEKIIISLQQALEQLELDAANNNPLAHYYHIPKLEEIWLDQRLPELLKDPDPLPTKNREQKELKKQQLDIARFPNILKMWIKAEQYFDTLQVLYEDDPQFANMLIDTYFKVLELWFVKLLGETCRDEKLSVNANTSYKIGSLPYYTKSTLGNFQFFLDHQQTPYKADRIHLKGGIGKNGLTEFIGWRNDSFHKIPFTLEEAKKIRTQFYTCIIILMDALREID